MKKPSLCQIVNQLLKLSCFCLALSTLSFSQMPELINMEIMNYGGTDAYKSYGSYIDWDGDGLVDFINVENNNANFQGKIRIFKNNGTSTNPKFEFKDYVKHESGTALSLPIG